ncbi:MAG: nitroreductase family protein [Lachnospiraceae bacterium]|nr:nitroreductase family protein [Lachnospiraceae bacterium]
MILADLVDILKDTYITVSDQDRDGKVCCEDTEVGVLHYDDEDDLLYEEAWYREIRQKTVTAFTAYTLEELSEHFLGNAYHIQVSSQGEEVSLAHIEEEIRKEAECSHQLASLEELVEGSDPQALRQAEVMASKTVEESVEETFPLREILHRSSIRKFQDRPVEKEKIRQILRAAMQAPSAGNQQPWEFYIVTDPDMIESLSKSSPYAGPAAHAPVVIVSAYRKNCQMPEYAEIDLSIAMENLWIATEAIGLGGVWLGIAPIRDRMAKVEDICHIPDTQHAFALFPIGYPAEVKKQQNRFDESRIHYC